MKEFFTYLIESGICLGAFFLIYYLFLRRGTFFVFNRFFLMAGLAAAAVLPAVNLSYRVEAAAPLIEAVEHILPQAGETAAAANSALTSWAVILTVYLSGIFLLLLRNAFGAANFYGILRSAHKTRHPKYTLLESPRITTPFSLFRYIGLNRHKLSDTESDIIIRHELSHVTQRHWFDLVCSECALLLQWFNPFAWLYVTLLKENHEFLADRAVMDEGTPVAFYRATLLNQQFRGPVFSFSNTFSFFKTPNRLSMITKRKSSSWRLCSALAVLPLLGMYLWASAEPEYVYIAQAATEKNEAAIELEAVVVFSDNTQTVKPERLIVQNKPLVLPATSGKPLIVLDGKVVEGVDLPANITSKDIARIMNIPEETIESVTALKDGTAMDLWGEQGRNGVIEIKTKKQTVTPERIDVARALGNTGNPPLVILDGKVVEGIDLTSDMSNITGNDIARIMNIPEDALSVTIINGKVATGMWGERGSNGVIEVRTKPATKTKASDSYPPAITVAYPPKFISGNFENWMLTTLREKYGKTDSDINMVKIPFRIYIMKGSIVSITVPPALRKDMSDAVMSVLMYSPQQSWSQARDNDHKEIPLVYYDGVVFNRNGRYSEVELLD